VTPGQGVTFHPIQETSTIEGEVWQLRGHAAQHSALEWVFAGQAVCPAGRKMGARVSGHGSSPAEALANSWANLGQILATRAANRVPTHLRE